MLRTFAKKKHQYAITIDKNHMNTFTKPLYVSMPMCRPLWNSGKHKNILFFSYCETNTTDAEDIGNEWFENWLRALFRVFKDNTKFFMKKNCKYKHGNILSFSLKII